MRETGVKIEVSDVRTKAQRISAVPDEDTKMSGDVAREILLISACLGKGSYGRETIRENGQLWVYFWATELRFGNPKQDVIVPSRAPTR